jgi:hypothetical protein
MSLVLLNILLKNSVEKMLKNQQRGLEIDCAFSAKKA